MLQNSEYKEVVNSLTNAMFSVLINDKFSVWNKPNSKTYEGLYNRGLLEKSQGHDKRFLYYVPHYPGGYILSQKGFNCMFSYYANLKPHWLFEDENRQLLKSNIIYNDEQIWEYYEEYKDKGVCDVYVYGGHEPMLVLDGDGQNPIAWLHPYYHWQIRNIPFHRDMYQKVPVMGWKGSYCYKLKEDVFLKERVGKEHEHHS